MCVYICICMYVCTGLGILIKKKKELSQGYEIDFLGVCMHVYLCVCVCVFECMYVCMFSLKFLTLYSTSYKFSSVIYKHNFTLFANEDR